ncbi:MAG: PAC2 family protein [Acidimicrobiales bacterium]
MSSVRWSSRPNLTQPVVVAAFEGWNDAGESATEAVRHLREAWGAVPFADIDPEEFYDFTAVRPMVQMADDGTRSIQWPQNEFWWATPPGSPGVILVRGIEPQLKWRTFCEQVLEVATTMQARLVVTLGALLADVAHTRPTSVFGTAYDQKVAQALHLEESRYEGPTGVVGVLHDACHERGVNSASLWAAVPSYVPAAPSPKAALALVERVCAVLGTTSDNTALAQAGVAYEEQISDLVLEDEETAAYVAHLEETYDREAVADHTADELVSEVEQFLRGQSGS